MRCSKKSKPGLKKTTFWNFASNYARERWGPPTVKELRLLAQKIMRMRDWYHKEVLLLLASWYLSSTTEIMPTPAAAIIVPAVNPEASLELPLPTKHLELHRAVHGMLTLFPARTQTKAADLKTTQCTSISSPIPVEMKLWFWRWKHLQTPVPVVEGVERFCIWTDTASSFLKFTVKSPEHGCFNGITQPIRSTGWNPGNHINRYS